MNKELNEFIRAYVLPIVVVGASSGALGNVVVQAGADRAHSVRPQVEQLGEQRQVADDSKTSQKLSPRPEEFLDFLKSYHCLLGQWEMFEESLEYQKTPDFRAKGQEFLSMLETKGYFPSSESVKKLESLCDGKGYDFGVSKENDRWLLSYRTKEAPSPFKNGFTLIEPGTNPSIKETFGERSSLASPGVFHYYLMNQQGVIEYLVTLDSENCNVMKPHTLVFRTWLQGGQWEDLAFAQTQKRVSRKLDEMAGSSQPELLNLNCGAMTGELPKEQWEL